MKHIKYQFGQVVGDNNLIFLEECDRIPDPSKKYGIRSARFFCTCGKTFISRIADVLYGKTKGCNCRKNVGLKQYRKGELINGIEFISSLGTDSFNKHRFHRAIFKCPLCGNEWNSLINNIQAGHTKSCGCMVMRGWTRTMWINYCDKATLYKIRMFNDYEDFIKIGITSKNNPLDRFKVFPYNVEVLKLIEGDSGYIFDLERRAKRMFKKYSYKPLLNFGGETECYGHNNMYG